MGRTVEFKYDQGDVLETKLGAIGIVESLCFNDVVQYLIQIKDGTVFWVKESNIKRLAEPRTISNGNSEIISE